MPPASARLSNAGRARRQQNTEVMSLGEIPSPNRLDADDTDSVWRAGQAAAPPRRSPGLHSSIVGHFKPKHVQAGPLELAMKNAIIEFDRPLGRHRKVGSWSDPIIDHARQKRPLFDPSVQSRRGEVPMEKARVSAPKRGLAKPLGGVALARSITGMIVGAVALNFLVACVG